MRIDLGPYRCGAQRCAAKSNVTKSNAATLAVRTARVRRRVFIGVDDYIAVQVCLRREQTVRRGVCAAGDDIRGAERIGSGVAARDSLSVVVSTRPSGSNVASVITQLASMTHCGFRIRHSSRYESGETCVHPAKPRLPNAIGGAPARNAVERASTLTPLHSPGQLIPASSRRASSRSR